MERAETPAMWRKLASCACGRILHHNVTAYPTAEWTLQQFRGALPGDHGYRFMIHDRDAIFSKLSGLLHYAILMMQAAKHRRLRNAGSYGFRPKRSAQQAIYDIRKWVTYGHDKVIDLDLKELRGSCVILPPYS